MCVLIKMRDLNLKRGMVFLAFVSLYSLNVRIIFLRTGYVNLFTVQRCIVSYQDDRLSIMLC